MAKKINMAEVNALVNYLPARVKGNFTFDVCENIQKGTLTHITKDLHAKASTLKAAVKEIAADMVVFDKMHEPVHQMAFVYFNGFFIGTMTIGEDRDNIRCDFSAWAMNNATEEPETEETTAEEVAEVEETESNEEETNAAHLLNVYLFNETDIYNLYIAPAIDLAASTIKGLSDLNPEYAIQCAEGDTYRSQNVAMAVQRAKSMVGYYDHETVTYKEIKGAKIDLTDYIIECAKYQAKQAI